MRRKLPIGIQTFSKIRGDSYYYVDKTHFVSQLAESGSYYFLSRPRRFGKSLFLDTLKEAFSGNRPLFQGLYLEHNWNWEIQHPVIHLTFADGRFQSEAQLEHHIHVELERNAASLKVALSERREGIHVRFRELIQTAAAAYGGKGVVVLVDEYDKPILDNLTAPEIARTMRDGLRNLYSVIKGQDAYLRFIFLTGVSKFSKVSIFSGLNNLSDLTLDGRYATICGYTDQDIDRVFWPELEGFDRAEIRRWYNGYRWLGEPVYNPFDVLLLFDKREFRSWWFETGSPTFLVDWLKARRFFSPRLEWLTADEALLSAFDVEAIELEAMLWQTGYVTIVESMTTPLGDRLYRLRVPNREVRAALNRALACGWGVPPEIQVQSGLQLLPMFRDADVMGMRSHFEALFASIPHDWIRNNPIARYEGYFASVFYSHLAALGLDITAEDVSNQGRCDLAVRFGNRVFLFEFKIVDGENATGEALRQLKSRDYAAKYRNGQNEIIQIGIEFSRSLRQIVGWQVEAQPAG